MMRSIIIILLIKKTAQVNHNQPTPLKFSTSPPVDVHKPRRSLSPQNGCWQRRSASPPLREEVQKPVGALINILGDQPCLMSTGEDSSSQMSKTPKSCYGLTLTAKKTISPRKRSRTARVEHIQRPCLDFEKMQQVRWRGSWSRSVLTV